MLKIYLDNCCYNRPFDDLKQEKIKKEAEAITRIINMFKEGKIKIYKSRAIEYELSKISTGVKKKQVQYLYNELELEHISYTYELDKRVLDLEKYNIHYMDAYHIAYAESKNIDYLITVDKQLINGSKRAKLQVKVINPIEFIMEVV